MGWKHISHLYYLSEIKILSDSIKGLASCRNTMPSSVSPLIRAGRWSAVLLGIAYGSSHNKTIVGLVKKDNEEAARKALEVEEAKKAAKALADAEPSILQ